MGSKKEKTCYSGICKLQEHVKQVSGRYNKIVIESRVKHPLSSKTLDLSGCTVAFIPTPIVMQPGKQDHFAVKMCSSKIPCANQISIQSCSCYSWRFPLSSFVSNLRLFRSALEVVSLRSLVVLHRGKEQVLGESTSGKRRNNVRFCVNQQTTLGRNHRNLPQSEIGDKKDKRAYSVCIISSPGKFRFERADGSTCEPHFRHLLLKVEKKKRRIPQEQQEQELPLT